MHQIQNFAQAARCTPNPHWGSGGVTTLLRPLSCWGGGSLPPPQKPLHCSWPFGPRASRTQHINLPTFYSVASPMHGGLIV